MIDSNGEPHPAQPVSRANVLITLAMVLVWGAFIVGVFFVMAVLPIG